MPGKFAKGTNTTKVVKVADVTAGPNLATVLKAAILEFAGCTSC